MAYSLDEGEICLFLGYKSKQFQLQWKKNKHLEGRQRAVGTQEIMPIWGLIFQITSRLLRVAVRPWTQPNLMKISKQRLEFFPSHEGYVANKVRHSQSRSPTQFDVFSSQAIED